MPQHIVRIIDSSGNPGKMKLRRIREHQAAGRGKFNEDGIFVFQRHHCQPNVGALAPARRVSLADVLALITDYPNHNFKRDERWSDLRTSLPFHTSQTTSGVLRREAR